MTELWPWVCGPVFWPTLYVTRRQKIKFKTNPRLVLGTPSFRVFGLRNGPSCILYSLLATLQFSTKYSNFFRAKTGKFFPSENQARLIVGYDKWRNLCPSSPEWSRPRTCKLKSSSSSRGRTWSGSCRRSLQFPRSTATRCRRRTGTRSLLAAESHQSVITRPRRSSTKDDDDDDDGPVSAASAWRRRHVTSTPRLATVCWISSSNDQTDRSESSTDWQIATDTVADRAAGPTVRPSGGGAQFDLALVSV